MKRALYEPYLDRRSWSPEELARIGFYDDGMTQAQVTAMVNDLRWVTPTNHLASRGVVLVATGAFSPFHSGHIRMLDLAKRNLESQGVAVAGAYIHPDHDAYVSRKGAGVYPASARIHIAQEATKDIPWLAVDPWNALFQKRDLNYTTVLARTQKYLSQFGDYRVVFVCGSDNRTFAEAFNADEFVVVGRPGQDDAHPSAIDLSSTRMRAFGLATFAAPDPGTPYLIRGDLEWATAHWQVPPAELEYFMDDLSAAFYDIWRIPPIVLSVAKQAERLRSFREPHISFDRVTGSTHWVSRVFDACTHQHSPVQWLSSDLSNIPAGEFALVDDDIASGTTVRRIIDRTPQVKWTKVIGMADWIQPRPWFDVVDARDFLFGARGGGLWVSENRAGKRHLYRAPYISPWVNLAQRARISPLAQPAFNHAILRANLRFFRRVPFRVGDTDNIEFWQRLGFTPDTPMTEVCNELLKWNPN